ncbi:MAG: MATE family efflux transporter [Deltaproteobacteria bacterium]|nr:MATE family efflux transporter [Deltaproteobacteria bacterium]
MNVSAEQQGLGSPTDSNEEHDDKEPKEPLDETNSNEDEGAGLSASEGTGLSASEEKREALLSAYVEDPGIHTTLFGIEPILAKRILHLGVPVIIGMLTQTFINIIDSVMVGRLPDEKAVAGMAAIGPSLKLLWMFGGFLSAIAVGTQAVTARRYGEGDSKGAGRALTNSLILALVSGILVTLTAVLSCEPIFQFLIPGESSRPAREAGILYSEARFYGIFAMAMMASYKSFYDGVGQVRVHMTVAIIMNILNVVLNYGLIFGNLGMPRLEVEGAAWASVAASTAGLIIMAAWSLRGEDRKAFRVYRLSNFNPKVMWTIGKLSLGGGIATVVAMGGFLMFDKIVAMVDEENDLPNVNLAANATIITISMICFMATIAFGTATATLVSQSLGAKKSTLARRYGWQSVKLVCIFTFLIGLTVIIDPEFILGLFLHIEEGTDSFNKQWAIDIALLPLFLAGFGAPLAGTAMVLVQALYGAGESIFVMYVELVLHVIVFVPLAWLLGVYLEGDLVGCWFALGIYGIGLVGAMGWKFYGGSWEQNEL